MRGNLSSPVLRSELRGLHPGNRLQDKGLPHLSRQVVRLAQGFGNSIPTEAPQDDIEGSVKVRQVPG